SRDSWEGGVEQCIQSNDHGFPVVRIHPSCAYLNQHRAGKHCEIGQGMNLDGVDVRVGLTVSNCAHTYSIIRTHGICRGRSARGAKRRCSLWAYRAGWLWVWGRARAFLGGAHGGGRVVQRVGRILPVTSPKSMRVLWGPGAVAVMVTSSPSSRKARSVPSGSVMGSLPDQVSSSRHPRRPGSGPLTVPEAYMSP